jgi:hypothetical protein
MFHKLGEVVVSRQRGRYKITNPRLCKENFKGKEKLVTGPDGGLTPGQTGRVTVCRKMSLTIVAAPCGSYRVVSVHFLFDLVVKRDRRLRTKLDLHFRHVICIY